MILVLISLFCFFLPQSLPDRETERGSTTDNRRIALSFVGEDFIPSAEQLNEAFSMGIDLLELSDPSQFDDLSGRPFNIFLSTENRFPTISQIISEREKLIEEIVISYRRALDLFPGRIEAVGLFSYPNETDPRFSQQAALLADTLKHTVSVPFYFRSVFFEPSQLPEHFDFASGTATPRGFALSSPHPIIHFYPSPNSRESLLALESLFFQKHTDSVIIIPAEWFFKHLDQQNDLGIVITSWIDGEPLPVPLPPEEEPAPPPNWNVFLLFAIWASFLIHFKVHPLYANSLSRYIFNHTFFVADMMEHRIRSKTPGIVVLVQHALLAGLCVTVIANTLLSDFGFSVLSWHFPFLFGILNERFSLFLLGTLAALVIEFASVLWIYLSNKNLKNVSQVLGLYIWPLHFNLIVVTLLVILYQKGVPDIWLLILPLFFIAIWGYSFNSTAMNTAKFLGTYNFWKMLPTIAIQVLTITLGVWVFLFSRGISEPLKLAISVP